MMVGLLGAGRSARAQSSACYPPCRAGFICAPTGQCISACNPECRAGERCTEQAQCLPIGPPSAPQQAPGSGIQALQPYEAQPTQPYGAPPPYPAAPAPGYGSPPPGWRAPNAAPYGSPPRTYVPPRTRRRHGFLVLPFLGLNSYRGDSGSGLGPGLRFGTLLGGRINDLFSLNGEVTFDLINVSHVNPGDTYTSTDFDLAISPLFHFDAGNVQFVVGPKLGLEVNFRSYETSGTSGSGHSEGVVAGFNTGVFVHVSPSVALGGLISFVVRDDTSNCNTSGDTETCSSDINYPSVKVLGIAFGALF